MQESVDVVYTWVDGADPDFVSSRLLWQQRLSVDPAQNDVCSHRFRNNDEIRFSLRSVASFMPWIGKVFVVTNGQRPKGLAFDQQRLILVTHEQLFPDRNDLPTFNSNAIEMHLHRIPGLSRRYLYFNDDLFIGRPVFPEDYYSAPGRRFYLDPIALHTDPDHGRVHDRAYACTYQHVLRVVPEASVPNLPAHCPQMYDRDVMTRLDALFAEQIRKTSSHRFRSPDDLVLRIAYAGLLSTLADVEMKRLEFGSSRYSLVILEKRWRPLIKVLHRLRYYPPTFFCINDDLDEQWQDRIILFSIRRLLSSLFPQPSVYERGRR